MPKRPFIEVQWRHGQALEQGRSPYPGFRPETTVDDGIMIERDIGVPMRDGVTIYTDICRPDAATRVPAIIAWSPYGKHDTGPEQFDVFPNRTRVPAGVPGRLTKWEAPDPEYWCRHGYAVVNPDARGSWMSEGDLVTVGEAEAADIYDLVEWVAGQSWCNGKVAMSGNSWLAQCQWFAAAAKPPHLAAIAPWEGWSDLYRDAVALGGITMVPANWIEFVWGGLHSRTRVEDCPSMPDRYPTWNEYWDSKMAKHQNSEVPAYVVASWGSRLHLRGSLEGFKQLGSREKWLRIHDGWEWPDYYAEANVEDLRRFFDRYLKGLDNGWESTPRVRIAILDQPRSEPSAEYRIESDWPLPGTQHHKLFLNAATRHMERASVTVEARSVYDAATGTASFDYMFGEDTELTGHMSLRLWVEAIGNDDLDLFVVAQKLDPKGKHVEFRTYGVDWPAEPARGFLRASHRELDLARSSPGQPWHSHAVEQRLAPSEIVPVDIEFWPMGCLWHEGEAIRVVVAGHPLLHVGDPVTGEPLRSSRNRGDHVIHTGGRYDSHLLIPMAPGTGRSAGIY